jgi:FMN phosphatase YigB (HAD superfamily)/DNA-binding XRE family transcriptional regulator
MAYMAELDEVGLGAKLQVARKRAGLTQQQLCHKANLSYSTLAKIERGAIKSPSIFTINRIAVALGTTLNELLGVGDPGSGAKQQSKSGVRFVYFDINGCLVRFFHRAFTKLAEDTGAPPDLIEMTFWHHNDTVCRGEMSIEDFNTEFARKLGVKEIEWQAYYLDAVDPIEEMQAVVAWAVERYNVGLLSNIMPGLIDSLLGRELLPALPYTVVIDSSSVGAIKPEPRIYEIAQERAGVPATEILLVDDSRSNLMAAEHQGWHVLWFDDYRPEESAERVRSALETA